MVIVEILGGFGNQLDAYACGYSVAKYLNQELVLDVSDYTQKGYCRPYCLDKLQIGPHRKLIYPPMSRGFMDADCIPKELRNNGLRIIKHEDYKTREELLRAVQGDGDIYLLGYGGIQYCTQEEQAEIKRQFQLKIPSSTVEQFKERIQQEYSVAVHIRRTDFVGTGSNCSTAYYKAAISYVKLFYPSAHFYFFSDDIQYVKEQFGPCQNYHYVHLLGGMDVDLEEFFCIAACNGRILTRQSTFSSWASRMSVSENKLDICQADDEGVQLSRNQVYLNTAAVRTLSAQYQAEAEIVQRVSFSPAKKDEILKLVSEGHNDEAIDTINRICIDSYGLSNGDTQELAVYKAIALAQKGNSGLPTALRLFYQQLQEENENPVFHANYFLALYQSGRFEEGAIHAALANRYGDREDYSAYFAQTVPFAQELYQLLRDGPVRHFIFIPIESWSNYITYGKTLAALLARMGQKVTFSWPPINTIETGADDTAIVKRTLENVVPADSIYRYHVDLISSYWKQSKGQKKALFYELVRQCSKRFDMPAVVIASHLDVLAESKVPGIKYVVPDICDPLNRERYVLDASGISMNDYIFAMSAYADAICLSGPVFDMVQKLLGDKVHRAFSTWEGAPYQILDTELDFTPNYIPLKEMIQNAAELLKI